MSDLIVFAGGGSGGHLFPGIALADALRQRGAGARVLFVGSDRDVERRIMAEHGLPHVALPLAPLRHLWRSPARFVWRNGRALQQSQQLLQRDRPRAVIGLGGLTSAPMVWAAHRAGVPVVLLEQNAIPGRATRWLAPFARVLCVSFPECLEHLPQHLPIIPSGNPVRNEIANLCRERSTQGSEKVLLVLGGSQGAQALNMALLQMVQRHRSEFARWTVVHQTGTSQVDVVRRTYTDIGQKHEVAEFFSNMAEQYRRATLVISRAGATTLAELACAAKPMALVPYPHAADDHQRANAEAFVRQGAAALVLQQSDPVRMAENLWAAITPWWHDSAVRGTIGDAARSLARPDATRRILSLLDDAVRSAA